MVNNSNRVYIGKLPRDCRERDVERFFEGYGRIEELMFKGNYAFIEFEDRRDAEDAVYELDGKRLNGEKVIVEHAKGTPKEERLGGGRGGRRSPPPRGRDGRPRWEDKYGPIQRTKYRVLVENLSTRVSWQDLKDFMRQIGEVTYADAHKERENEGIVEFMRRKDAKVAVDKLDGTELQGRNIRVIDDCEDGGDSKSGSESRSRSRSRSRNRSGRRRSRSRS